MAPNFAFENKLWKLGLNAVAGVDEVGRGAFAGPLVAAAVIIPSDVRIPSEIRIDDSKKLTGNQRTKASKWIKSNCIWGVGKVSVRMINNFGITKSNIIVFRKAIKSIVDSNERVQYILVDGYKIPYIRNMSDSNISLNSIVIIHENITYQSTKQMAIKKGDNLSLSIAAASIVAKVERDLLMTNIATPKINKRYGWSDNKGYGTSKHRHAIQSFGVTKYHRKQFVSNY